MENGFVNLVAVVGFLIVAIGLVPMVLFLGSQFSGSQFSGSQLSGGQSKQTEGSESKHD